MRSIASRSIIKTEHAKRATMTLCDTNRQPFETHATRAPQGDKAFRHAEEHAPHSVMLRSDAEHRVSKHHQNGAREACNDDSLRYESSTLRDARYACSSG